MSATGLSGYTQTPLSQMTRTMLKKILPLTLLCATSLATATPQSDRWHAKARELLEQTVNMPTVVGDPSLVKMANYLASQYQAAGFPAADIRVMPYDKTAALIVRWRAVNPSERPILIMAHMDVVAARREDWSDTDPFVFTEKDGYYYGRGTSDIKQGIAATTTALLKLKAEGFQPKRDLIVFYTGDEETDQNGSKLGATTWRNLLDAEYGLNADNGGGEFSANGKVLGFTMQTSEKTYASYTFTARNRGGHSSRPRADNAIYELADALKRLAAYRFEPVMTETTRAYFTGRAQTETGPVASAMRAWLNNPKDGVAADAIEADEGTAGYTRTRCVATRLYGGHADNALAQLATATVNCRIMPGVSPDLIKTELDQIVAGSGVTVTRADDEITAPDSPLRADVYAAFSDAVHARHPGAPIYPEMSAGATDAKWFRAVGIPVYGVEGSWVVAPVDLRAHGRDERLPVKALDDDVDHWVYLLRRLAGNR